MLLVSPTGSVAERIERLDNYAEWRDFGDDHRRTWGLKLVLDGGPETGALEERIGGMYSNVIASDRARAWTRRQLWQGLARTSIHTHLALARVT
jgi:hypothetical protein